MQTQSIYFEIVQVGQILRNDKKGLGPNCCKKRNLFHTTITYYTVDRSNYLKEPFLYFLNKEKQNIIVPSCTYIKRVNVPKYARFFYLQLVLKLTCN